MVPKSRTLAFFSSVFFVKHEPIKGGLLSRQKKRAFLRAILSRVILEISCACYVRKLGAPVDETRTTEEMDAKP